LINPQEPFFPTVMASEPTERGGFSNDILGGLNVREGVALHALQGLMSNPFLAQNQIGADSYVQMALGVADRFIAHINSELPPLATPPTPIRPR
jgi:hypothetical protein